MAHRLLTELRELRQEQGLTQSDVMTDLGMTQASVSRLERQDDAMLTTVETLARALGARLELVRTAS